MSEKSLADLVEFAENPEPRCPCVLLLDTSASMLGERLDALNEGLLTFQQDLKQDELAAQRVEIAIVTFGQQPQVVQDFVTAAQFEAPVLQASGMTPMGAAINMGLDMVRDRKESYKAAGVPYYRPWIFMITDGEPNDAEQWRIAAQRLAQEEGSNAVAFFAVGVEEANMEVLRELSVREPVKLKGLRFNEMFVWLSRSTRAVSQSKIGEQVPLPPAGWSQV